MSSARGLQIDNLLVLPSIGFKKVNASNTLKDCLELIYFSDKQHQERQKYWHVVN